MLIKALCDYYDILAKQGKVLPDGYSEVGISYLIALSEDGKLDSFIDIKKSDQRGKKTVQVPRSCMLFKRTEKTAIESNFIEHRPLYIFGLNYDNKKAEFSAEDSSNKAKNSHKAFVEKNLEFISRISSPIVDAYRSFIENWDSTQEECNEVLLQLGNEYSKSSFAFCLSGHPEILLHEDEALKRKWTTEFEKNKSSNDAPQGQCAITGDYSDISRIHGKIKGVIGGQASGTALVCFNNDSEYSYGKEQSYNSNISSLAMNKYTEALNYLLSSKSNHTIIDDTTVVFWSASGSQECDEIAKAIAFEDDDDIDDGLIKSVVDSCRDGTLTDDKLKNITSLDTDTDFYIVGIKPNNSRLSIKFVYRKQFGKLMLNIAEHQRNLKISEKSKPVSMWRIRKELISPKSKDEKVNPALMSKLFDSIINGNAYPDALLYTAVRRVKTDSDEENNRYIKMNDVRVGLIKACIQRKNKTNNVKEEFKLALDKDNFNQAYLCGRLFAVLEQIQQKASNYSLNRTIKDAYFSSAASKPASIFPKIMKLSQYHLSKIGSPKYMLEDIQEITDKLNNEFPEVLSLTEQGKFIIGYYQQVSYTDLQIKKYKEEN